MHLPLTYKVRFNALVFTKLTHKPTGQLSYVEFHVHTINGSVAGTTSHKDEGGARRQTDEWKWSPYKAFSFSLHRELKSNFLTSYYNADR